MKQRTVNTRAKVGNDGKARQPNERDEAPAPNDKPRSVMRQAASDLERGLVDTDLHGQRGAETLHGEATGDATARPLPGTRKD